MKNQIRMMLYLALTLILAFTCAAAPIVSPALNVLARENKMIKSGLIHSDVYFSEQDFMKCLGVPEIESVKVDVLPLATDGVLKLGTLHVTEGQTIKKEYLSMLRFVPADKTVTETEMVFSCGDTSVPCIVKILSQVNCAPKFLLEEDAVQTYRNVSCYGNVRASDPDGDPIELQIVAHPQHGTLTVTDAGRGNYKYTPTTDFIGEDRFVVVAQDNYGNFSSAQTIDVSVKKSGIYFTDVGGHWCENAAMALYAMGAVEVASYQNGLVFGAEDTVSREEFITMVMKTLGTSTLTDTNTSFADNAAIEVRYRPYIATAQRMGYIHGREVDGQMVFDPKASITKAEAAVIMQNILDIDEGDFISVFADDSFIPTWAKTAVYALTGAGVFNGDEKGRIVPSAILTRAQTVQMLYNTLQEK